MEAKKQKIIPLKPFTVIRHVLHAYEVMAVNAEQAENFIRTNSGRLAKIEPMMDFGPGGIEVREGRPNDHLYK